MNQLNLQTEPQGELTPTRRTLFAVRILTVGIALGLVLLAFIDRPVLQGGTVLGWAQWVLLGVAACLAVLCFAPLSWNQNALTVLISVVISLAITEFVLHTVLGPRFVTIYQRDDRVLYRLIPGAERVNVLPAINGGFFIRYKINSLGFRDAELARPGESLRVVVYGDSFIQGDFSRTEDTFTEQLRRRLAGNTGKSVEVVNAGVVGYGPDQELRRMEDELPALKPNIVIVAIYAGHDFGDLLRNKLYRLASDGSLSANPSVFLDDSVASGMKRSRTEPVLRKILRVTRYRLFGVPGQNFATGREARRARVDADLEREIAEYRQYVIEGDNAVHHLYSINNVDVSLTPASESARYKTKMMEQIMRRMSETAAKNNAVLLFLLIPSAIDVAVEHERGEVDPTKYPEYKRSTLTDILEQICERNEFFEVNLFAPFWGRRADGFYLKGFDDHWNPQGQAFAAELVSEFLSAQNLLGDPRPDSRTDAVVGIGHASEAAR